MLALSKALILASVTTTGARDGVLYSSVERSRLTGDSRELLLRLVLHRDESKTWHDLATGGLAGERSDVHLWD